MHILYCASGMFGEVAGVFHRTQCTEAPEASGAISVSNQRVQSAPDAGDLLCASPVLVRVGALDCVVF